MNLRCKVCGEKAAGFHFGAFTCEGCKSFFGRCCNNTSIIGECRNNKECIIDKKNRTSCKACRLQKCLLVGMSKSGSRYGRRSNWFKQYFQENEHHDETQSAKKSQSDQHENCNVALGSIKQLKKLDRTSPFSVVNADLYRKKISDLESHNKIPFDLSPTQPLISSHLYLNYFPHLGLNRLVTYKQSVAGENAFYIPHSIPFTTSFNPENNAKDYYEKLVITRVQNSELSDTINDDDPLDLSQKQTKKEHINSFGHEVESDFSKKALPLDLSVK